MSFLGAVIDGEPDETTAAFDVESTMILPFLAVTAVVPESVTAVPVGFSTRMAAVEYGTVPEPATALALADMVPATQSALNTLGELVLIET